MNRIIHTGLYSNRAYDVVNAMLQFIKGNISCSKNTFKLKSLKKTNAVRADDNEIVFDCAVISPRWSESSICGFNGWTDTQVLAYIAWMMKSQIKQRIDKASGFNAYWGRHCEVKFTIAYDSPTSHVLKNYNSGSVDIAVNEVYYVYDMFNKRKNIDKQYTEDFIKSFIGTSLDPIMVELKIAQREEITKIEEELSRKLILLDKECNMKQNESYTKFRIEYNDLKNAAREEAKKKIDKLKEQLASLSNVA